MESVHNATQIAVWRCSACDTSEMLSLPELVPVVLVHGGLHDDPPMTSRVFWVDSGVAAGLANAGVDTVLHDRPVAPRSWADEVAALVDTIEASGHDRVAVVAGSNGCSVALRLLLDRPDLVARTMLCWPATAGDTVVDGILRVIVTDVHGPEAAEHLLAGEPVRGVTSAELAAIDSEVVVYPSMPENKVHQRHTVLALLASIPDSIMVGGSPEPVDDAFAEFLDSYVSVVRAFSQIEPDD